MPAPAVADVADTITQQPAKAKLGRPSKYHPGLCRDVIEFCSQGYSLSAFAGSIGQYRELLHEWGEQHPEFLDACKRARAAAGLAWEDRARNAAMRGASGGQVAMIIFMLKNHAPDEFRERIEHTGKDGEALTLEVILGKVEAEKAEAIQAPMIEHEPSSPASSSITDSRERA